jgi:hypothetical protein
VAVIEPPHAARSNGRLGAWLTFVGLFIALSYASRLAATGERERDFLYEWTAFVGGVIQSAIVLGIVLLIARDGPARELLALRRPRGWGRAAAIMFGTLVATLVLSAALDPFLHAGDEQGLTPEGWDPDRAVPFAANFVVVAALVPLVEELTFRGLGFTLLERFGRTLTIVVVGVLFGLAHGLVNALPILVAFGIGLAYLRSRSDSVVPCVLLHGFFNAFALIASVTLGSGAG